MFRQGSVSLIRLSAFRLESATGSLIRDRSCFLQTRIATFASKKKRLYPSITKPIVKPDEAPKDESKQMPYYPDWDVDLEREINALQSKFRNVYSRGEYKEALKQAKHVLKVTTDAYGETHPATASSHNNLGLVLRQLGDFDLARKSYKTAMKTYKTLFGIDHASYAAVLHNVGTLNCAQVHLDDTLRATDKLTLMEESARLLQDAYDVRLAELTAKHPHTIASLSSLGATLAWQLLNNYKKTTDNQYVTTMSKEVSDQAWDAAGQHLREALDTAIANPRGPSMFKKLKGNKKIKPTYTSKLDGIHTLSAASAAQNLAIYLKIRGTTEEKEKKEELFQEAKQLYHKVMEVRGSLLPENHPDMTSTKYSLAELLSVMGDEVAANVLRQEIIDIYDPPGEDVDGEGEVVVEQVESGSSEAETGSSKSNIDTSTITEAEIVSSPSNDSPDVAETGKDSIESNDGNLDSGDAGGISSEILGDSSDRDGEESTEERVGLVGSKNADDSLNRA
jgi:tetratricopeptide (TPR) repeat protein